MYFIFMGQLDDDISYIYYYFLPPFTVSCMKLVIFLLYNNFFIEDTTQS